MQPDCDQQGACECEEIQGISGPTAGQLQQDLSGGANSSPSNLSFPEPHQAWSVLRIGDCLPSTSAGKPDHSQSKTKTWSLRTWAYAWSMHSLRAHLGDQQLCMMAVKEHCATRRLLPGCAKSRTFGHSMHTPVRGLGRDAGDRGDHHCSGLSSFAAHHSNHDGKTSTSFVLLHTSPGFQEGCHSTSASQAPRRPPSAQGSLARPHLSSQ